MKRGALLGLQFGFVAVVALWAKPVLLDGVSFGAMLGQPMFLVTNLIWAVAITALVGALMERFGKLEGGSAEHTTTTSGLDDSMQEIDR